nr:transposase, mutator type [Tanacetum cinerariifolium]
MNGFHFEVKGEFVEPMQSKLNITKIDLEVLDFDSFESDVEDDKERVSNRNVANEIVRAHAVETRRNIQIVKNDKIRAKAKCFGVVHVAMKMTKEMILNRAKEKEMKLLDQCKKVEGDLKEIGKAEKVNVQDKGKEKMEKFDCPTTLLPPKQHPQIGRPPKKKNKSVGEIDMVKVVMQEFKENQVKLVVTKGQGQIKKLVEMVEVKVHVKKPRTYHGKSPAGIQSACGKNRQLNPQVQQELKLVLKLQVQREPKLQLK